MAKRVSEERASRRPWHYLAPWYLAYGILGLITSGMLPFLMPLMVASTTSRPGLVAYVIGAYNIGLLTAPLLGKLAQSYHLFRPVFFGGFIALTLGLGAATQTSAFISWVPLALLCGVGAGAVATVAPLFVIGFAPKDEWDARIGWLQSFSGGGQLAGLLIAGLITQGQLANGFWVAAGLSAVAIVIGHFGLPSQSRRRGMRLPPLPWRQLMSGFQSGPPVGGLLQHSHNLQGEAWKSLPKSLGGVFGRFLLAWAVIHFGVAPFFAYYPLIMNDIYDVPPATTAVLYALAVTVGIGLFVLAGRAAQQYGAPLVFRLGLAVRIAGFGILAALALIPPPSEASVAMFGFIVVVLAWPVLSVSGTSLAARMAPPIGEGAAMGLLAASGAIATLLGTVLTGPLVETVGYGVIPPIAIIALLGAAVLMGRPRVISEAAGGATGSTDSGVQ
jgi:MFS family permease